MASFFEDLGRRLSEEKIDKFTYIYIIQYCTVMDAVICIKEFVLLSVSIYNCFSLIFMVFLSKEIPSREDATTGLHAPNDKASETVCFLFTALCYQFKKIECHLLLTFNSV